MHEDVPGDFLRKTTKYLGHVYGFQVDFNLFDSLIEGGRDRLRLRKSPFTSVVIPLLAPQYAAYGGSLFLSDDDTLTPKKTAAPGVLRGQKSTESVRCQVRFFLPNNHSIIRRKFESIMIRFYH